jgi:hypothetical protein
MGITALDITGSSGYGGPLGRTWLLFLFVDSGLAGLGGEISG